MTKKQYLKEYINNRIDLEGLKVQYVNSWLYEKPFNWLYDNGMVHTAFYKISEQGISAAGYKYPGSDRTQLTARNVWVEILNENKYFLTK